MAQGKLPAPPAKDWSLPQLHAAARAAGDIVRRAECGFVTANYWQLGRCQLLAKKLASDADYRAWKIALDIPDWRLSRAIGFAKVYKTQEAASNATVKEAEDKVRDKRAADGKKVHGSRFPSKPRSPRRSRPSRRSRWDFQKSRMARSSRSKSGVCAISQKRSQGCWRNTVPKSPPPKLHHCNFRHRTAAVPVLINPCAIGSDQGLSSHRKHDHQRFYSG